MRRILPVLILLLTPALADERKSYTDARFDLDKANFDELDAAKRDRLFEAYGRWDHHEVIRPLAEIIARYGTYMAVLEWKQADFQKRIRPLSDRTAMTDQEIGMRNSLQRKIDRLEEEILAAERSLEVLGRVLGGYGNDRTIEQALMAFGKAKTWRVRQVLAMACGNWHKFLRDAKKSKKAFAALRKLRADEEPRVRLAVARSMGHFRSDASLTLLKESMKDADWRVRGEVVRSLGKRKNAAAVTVLIDTMKREKGRIVDDINKVLQSITGQDFRYPEQWTGWWKAVGGKIPRGEAKRSDRRDTSAKAKPKKHKADHRFYGIPTSSDRICYIIDVSGSMRKKVEEWKRVTITGRKQAAEAVTGKTRMDVAKNELKRALYNLNSKKRFTIIFFSNKVQPWKSEPVFANRGNKLAAMKDTDSQAPAGSTYTLGALREAFAIAGVLGGGGAAKTGKGRGLGVDTIFLLSDGAPTNNSLESPELMDPEVILNQVRQWNKDAGIIIHTVAVHTTPAGTHFLKQLAAQNGGVFRERKNPTKKSDKKKKQQ